MSFGHAAPGLVGVEEFHHGRFGGRETLHQRADVLALSLALAGSADGPGPLFRIAAQLQEIVALHRSGLRGRSAGCCGQGAGGQ